MTTLLAWVSGLAAVFAVSASDGAAPVATGKLAPAVSKEMTEIILSLNKVLGLESWPARGVTPCLDRGGQGINVKNVGAEETRKCAATALNQTWPGLGKSYVLAIPMVTMGPVTVMAVGIGDSAGWAAYSCDPERKCNPVKLSAPTKWGKRMAERTAKACAEPSTLWFPADQRACSEGNAATTAAATTPAPTTPAPAAPAQAPTAQKDPR